MRYDSTCARHFLGLAGCALASLVGVSANAETYEGAPVKIGSGEAKTVVYTDASNKPNAISIVFTPGMLTGLPQPDHNMADVPFSLAMPTSGPKTIVDHVVINWEAHGHPPPKIYDVPHFDFHFYLVNEEHQAHVMFKNDMASGDPAQQPPAELLPAGYKVPPGTAVSQMGVHAINLSSPEFNGKPFTATFIYGYYDKKLTFIEPMASLSFLQSKPSFTQQIPHPQKFTFDGQYPSSYSIKFDPGKERYEVSLESLR